MDDAVKLQIRHDVENALGHIVQAARKEHDQALANAQTDAERDNAELRLKKVMSDMTKTAQEMFQARWRDYIRSQQPSRSAMKRPTERVQPQPAAAGTSQLKRYHLTDPGVQKPQQAEASGRPSRTSPPATRHNTSEEEVGGDGDEDDSEDEREGKLKEAVRSAIQMRQPVPGPSRPAAARVPPGRNPRAPPMTSARTTPQMWKPPPVSTQAPSGVARALQQTPNAPAKATNAAGRTTPAGPGRGVKAGAGSAAEHPRMGARAGASSGASPPDVHVSSASPPQSTQRSTSGAPPVRAAPAQRSTSSAPRAIPPSASAPAARRAQPVASTSARAPPVKTSASASASASTPTRPVPIPTTASKSTHLAPPAEKMTKPSGSLSSSHSWSEVDDGVSGSSHGSAHIVYTGPKGARRHEAAKDDERQKTGSPSTSEGSAGEKVGPSPSRSPEDGLGLRAREDALRMREEFLELREAAFREETRRREDDYKSQEATLQALRVELHNEQEATKLRAGALSDNERAFHERVASDARQAEQRRLQESAEAAAKDKAAEDDRRTRATETERQRKEDEQELEARRVSLEEGQERLRQEREQFEAERSVLTDERREFAEEEGVFRARVAEFESWVETMRAAAEAQEQELQRRETAVQAREIAVVERQSHGETVNAGAQSKDGIVNAGATYEALHEALFAEAQTLEREAAALDAAVSQDRNAITALEQQLHGLETKEDVERRQAEVEERRRANEGRAQRRARADSVKDAYTWFR